VAAADALGGRCVRTQNATSDQRLQHHRRKAMKYWITSILLITAAAISVLYGLMMVLALVIGFSTFWFVLVLNIQAYRRVRRLGYFPPTTAILVLGVDAVPLFAVIGVIVLLLPDTPDYWYVWGKILLCIMFIGIAMFVALGCAVLVRKLPKRDPRVVGLRRARFPFVSLGYLTIAGGFAGAAALAALMIAEMIIDPHWRISEYITFSIGIFSYFLFICSCGVGLIMTGMRVRNQVTI
jgi:hypothetical protein